LTASAAEVPPPRALTAAQKREAVAALAKQLRDRYCIAGTAEAAAVALEKKLEQGGYDTYGDDQAFSAAVTADLVAATKDKHLKFGAAPPPEPAPTTSTAEPAKYRDREQAQWRAGVRRGNNGFLRAEILCGNVGYLDVRRFQPPDMAVETLVGAMAFLANADAIIVDVRNCHGGSAHMMPYFGAYFVAKPTHLFDMEFRGDSFTDHYWTLAYVPGKRMSEVPMYILTSAYTFSGAEGFAYRFQVLKRATIVGETTGGGANAGGVLDVPPFFRVYMPMGRPVDGKTGTNWEGTGVLPDLATSARDALSTAHISALKTLRAKAGDDADRTRLDWALQRAEAARDPVNLTAKDLDRFSGTYGTWRVWAEGGQLRAQEEADAPLLLSPLTGTLFAADAEDPKHFEFMAGTTGKISVMVFTDRNYQSATFNRGSSGW
jgi:hypothetical protein